MTLALITTEGADGRREATVLHRPPATAVPWWSTAAAYESLPVTTVTGLLDVGAHVSHVAGLGCDTLLLAAAELDPRHPGVAQAVGDLVRRAHRRGVRVLAQVAPLERGDTPARLVVRARTWLGLGVDGVDLDTHRGPWTGELLALVAEDDLPLTGAVTGADRTARSTALTEDWLHATRDDRLLHVTWSAADVAEDIADAFRTLGPLGAHPGWAVAPGGARGLPATGRARDAGRLGVVPALSIMLPGSVTLRQGCELGPLADVPGTMAGLVEAVAPMRHREDSPYESLRTWLRIRQELGSADGHLGALDAVPGACLLVLDARYLLVTFDVGAQVPDGLRVSHGTRPPVTGDAGVTLVPPHTLALLRGD